jgi:hypothetical protein
MKEGSRRYVLFFFFFFFFFPFANDTPKEAGVRLP